MKCLLVLGVFAHTLKLLLGSSGVASSGVEVVSDTSSSGTTDDERSARLGHFDCCLLKGCFCGGEVESVEKVEYAVTRCSDSWRDDGWGYLL
jgi:hypothetical protein